jgi:ferric-dicitrate binding protein FerR (iron transport regulator)
VKTILMLLTVFMLLSGSAHAAKLGFVQGDVAIESGASGHKAAPAAKGASLESGDRVVTGKESLAIVDFDDGSQAKIGPKSAIAYKAVNGVELVLDRGTVFSKVAKQDKYHGFRIQTKSATMGVRGTQFFTSMGATPKSQDDLWMCVKEGSVEVTANSGKNKVLVKEGEGILVPKNGEITPPKPYEWTRGLNWNMDPGKGDVVDHSNVDAGYDLLKQNYD